jgi:hypothetical protein
MGLVVLLALNVFGTFVRVAPPPASVQLPQQLLGPLYTTAVIMLLPLQVLQTFGVSLPQLLYWIASRIGRPSTASLSWTQCTALLRAA